MTAQPDEGGYRPTSWPDMTPSAIRAALHPDDRARFDASMDTAMRRAVESHDLAALDEVLVEWRHWAVITADRATRERILGVADAALAGEPVTVHRWDPETGVIDPVGHVRTF